MASRKKTGSEPFLFVHREDLRRLPTAAAPMEPHLHGGFAVDGREGFSHVYHGMPGHGLVKVSPDLTSQKTIDLPPELKPLNFHSTKIGMFDGKVSLILPANENEKVAVLSLEGQVEHVSGFLSSQSTERRGLLSDRPMWPLPTTCFMLPMVMAPTTYRLQIPGTANRPASLAVKLMNRLRAVCLAPHTVSGSIHPEIDCQSPIARTHELRSARTMARWSRAGRFPQGRAHLYPRRRKFPGCLDHSPERRPGHRTG